MSVTHNGTLVLEQLSNIDVVRSIYNCLLVRTATISNTVAIVAAELVVLILTSTWTIGTVSTTLLASYHHLGRGFVIRGVNQVTCDFDLRRPVVRIVCVRAYEGVCTTRGA